jgi:hypothetical protein
MDGDLGFRFAARAGGDVAIRRGGRVVTTLRGADARRFLARVAATDAPGAQQVMARATGNHRRGNERRTAGETR